MSAALIFWTRPGGKIAGSPKRRWMAERSRASTVRYSPPISALNGEIMSPITYSGASWSIVARRPSALMPGLARRTIVSTTSVCCATDSAWSPDVWPFQRATRASPCAMSSSSTSSGDGSRRSSRRPDSMRCQTRGGAPARSGMVGLHLVRRGPPESGPGRNGKRQADSAGRDRRSGVDRRARPVETHQRQSPVTGMRTENPDRPFAGHNLGPYRRERGAFGEDDPPPRRSAVLHARDDFLADIAALPEVDAAKLVHVDIVRKYLAIGEVGPALGDAEGDAVRVIGGPAGIGERTRLALADVSAHPQSRMATVADVAGFAGDSPLRDDGELLAIRDRLTDPDLRAKLVETESLDEIDGDASRNIQAVAAIGAPGDEKIEENLPLRRQKRAPARLPGWQFRYLAGDQVLQEPGRVFPGDGNHRSVGKIGGWHSDSVLVGCIPD